MQRMQKNLCATLNAILTGSRSAIPEGGQPLLAMFFQLSEARSWHGNGPNPLSFSEIEAWMRLTGTPLRPHHVETIRALDATWMLSFYRRTGKAPEGTKTLPPMSAHPLTAALFDVAAG